MSLDPLHSGALILTVALMSACGAQVTSRPPSQRGADPHFDGTNCQEPVVIVSTPFTAGR